MAQFIVSIVCPIFNEERFIVACVESMLRQDYPQDNLEILLVDGRSTDRTRERLQPYLDKEPRIRLLDNPKRIAPCAMNIGIAEAKGEYIVRMDAHAHYPDSYVSTLIQALQTLPNAQNVGCCLHTKPQGDTKQAQAIAIACSHPFGVGNALFRVKEVKEPVPVETVPFGCWRKSWFEQVGLFNESLIRGQDFEMNVRTTQAGGKIYLLPEPVIDYYARENIRKMSRMFYQYALVKPLVNQTTHRPKTWRQLVPPIFVVGLIVGAVLSGFFSPIRWLYGLCLFLYALATVVIACQNKNAWLPIVFLCMHICYGVGYWVGLFKLCFHQPIEVTPTR